MLQYCSWSTFSIRMVGTRNKERDSNILERLLNAALVPKDTSSITRMFLRVQRRRQLEVADLLRLNVN